MNTTRKMTYLLTSILLSSTLAGYERTPATATTVPALESSASVANPFTFNSIPSTRPTSTTLVAQAHGTRYLGAIQFPLGATTASATNFVEGDGIDRYTFDAAGGQSARISISSQTGQVLLTLIAPDGTPIMRSQTGGTSWSGILPMNGTYKVDAVNQYIGSRYRVNLNIQPAGGGGNRTQIHNRGSIEFPADGTYTSVNGYLVSQNIDRYHFTAHAGQPVNLAIRSPGRQVVLTLIDPNGNPIVRYQSGATSWSGRLPANGNYQIDVANQSDASSYNLKLSIR